jgi:hypothetical protein
MTPETHAVIRTAATIVAAVALGVGWSNRLGVLTCEGVWRARRDSNPQPSDP